MSYTISIVLDTRRIKDNNLFPVKLRVYSKSSKRAKLYTLNIDFTQAKFTHIWTEGQSNKLRGGNKDLRLKLNSFEIKAEKVAKDLDPFNFEQFENKFFRRTVDANDIIFHFNNALNKSIRRKKIGTAESYKNALKSITQFFKQTNQVSEISKLPFDAITPEWLENYEEYMLSNGKSITTVAIYTRTLRVIFNNAIADNDINQNLYPFGKRKYQIPETKGVKKALTKEQLSVLFNSIPKTPEQEKAKDFWFFSYACNGMNLKDVCQLRYIDIEEDKFSYYRAKTFKKSRTKTKIEVFLTDFTKGIIEKYETKDLSGYVFPVLLKKSDEITNYKRIKNLNRFVNQHIKKLAKNNGLPEELSSYWARHSFATNAIRNGASMEFISDAFNHSDLSVTKNYFAGFEDKTKKDFADKLMDF